MCREGALPHSQRRSDTGAMVDVVKWESWISYSKVKRYWLLTKVFTFLLPSGGKRLPFKIDEDVILLPSRSILVGTIDTNLLSRRTSPSCVAVNSNCF